MSAITSESRPMLAAKARLRWDRQTSRYLLLYPERGLVLNPTAAGWEVAWDGMEVKI